MSNKRWLKGEYQYPRPLDEEDDGGCCTCLIVGLVAFIAATLMWWACDILGA